VKQVRRNEEERRRLVGKWKQGGTGIVAFCEEHGIPYRSFKRWQAELSECGDAHEDFLPVVIRTAPSQGVSPCRIRVGPVVIECDEGTSGQAVETAIRAAVTACGPMSGA